MDESIPEMAQADYFRLSWAVSIGTFCAGFQVFCKEALELEFDLRWTSCSERDLTLQEKRYLDGLKKRKGFLNKDSKREFQDKILIAKMFISCATEKNAPELKAFPVGFAAVRIYREKHIVQLKFYSIRKYYRKMRLSEKMLKNLKNYYLKDPFKKISEIEVDLRQTEKGRKMRNLFEEIGYKIVDELENGVGPGPR
jgi:hypothetical protein